RAGACRQLEDAIDTAISLGASKGVVHADSDAVPEVWDHSTIRERIHDSIDRLTTYCKNDDFVVCVENVKSPFIDAADVPALLEKTSAEICLDTGHAHVTGQDASDLAMVIRRWGDRITHVHLNDTRRESDDEHLPVGMGSIEFEALADAMIDANWSGSCTHEIFGFDIEYARYGRERFNELLGTRQC
ncbi:MAG: sugar phosphate isomerase/epimerase family protein, partial [Halobacteriaceae archaeon]